MPLIRVALDVPLAQLFDYHCTDSNARIGARVLVPFGRQQLVGVIVAMPTHSDFPAAKIKTCHQVLDHSPLLQRADLRLIEFAADYYLHPLGAVVMATIPVALRRHSTSARAPAVIAYRLSALGQSISVDDIPAKARAQRNVLQLLQQSILTSATIRQRGLATRRAMSDFLQLGWVETTDLPTSALLPPADLPAPAPELTPAQRAAVTAIESAHGHYQAILLRGITGSGKTEVYLHAMAKALALHQQVLFLVPEIALTPQLFGVLAARFPNASMALLHSGLNDQERLKHWQAARLGEARIVLGTRLAVFAPLPALGLIIVDEEHDASFKQGDGFRYSARDLAVVRARHMVVPIVLGSATPALETYRNALDARYQLVTLPNRIHAKPPLITCINLRHERATDGLSPSLVQALRTRLSRGEQSMVFINRRGYAPVLMCSSCGWNSACKRCSAKLVVHLRDRRLRCHHCGHDSAIPPHCPECGDADIAPLGQGTQRVESALVKLFPEARILRVDRDSVSRKHAWRDMREHIQQRQVDILVGTQILAKGHDFPHLNLVGVINADSMLYSTDFRAAERLYALLTQVAGRAGRGAQQGQVLIQTEFADHPLYTALRDQDFDGYAKNLLTERRQAGFPPYIHQALLRAEARDIATAITFLTAASALAQAITPSVTIYEPVPSSMMRKAGRERAQLLVQSASRQNLRTFLNAWQQQLVSTSTTARWSLDVDPAEF